MPDSEMIDVVWELAIPDADLNKDMLLTITVDDPQTCSSTLRKPDGKYAFGIIENVSLGTGSFIKSKKARSSTIATDYDEQSNTIVLRLSINEHEYSQTAMTHANGASVLFTIYFTFS
ncbi:MAG TPA: hypothetical protein VK826_17780 [Bacteroidia bacterium]|nr:hypothetical protein [Bacteroidia bacterium]